MLGSPSRSRAAAVAVARPRGRIVLWGVLGAGITTMILLPIAAQTLHAAGVGPVRFARIATEPVAVAAYGLTLGTALASTAANGLFGTILAWILVRYRFPLRRLADALVDLPLALPTAIAGITFAELLSPARPLGAWLASIGLPFAFAPPGIVLAMAFVSLPFVVRQVQPVLASLDRESEEAARSLGATRGQTLRLVIFPAILPAILGGMALSFARGVGEYGSVVLISGNRPFESLVASVHIAQKIEAHDTTGAAVAATVLLSLSLAILCAFGAAERWRTHGGA